MSSEPIATPEHWLAEGFAHHVVCWANELAAPRHTLDLLHEAACRVSLATASGHVCTHLGDIPCSDGSDAAAIRALLLESRVVGTLEAPANLPLILDDEGRIYLHRYFDYERRLARRLMLRTTMPLDAAMAETVRARLKDLFANGASVRDDRPDWQTIAAALAVLGNLTIISGGPGTGKTTTVVNLLACLLALDPNCRIALAAPTGKAGARMLEAIRLRAVHLPPELATRLPTESFTVHRLLGVLPATEEFRHHAGNPLPIDVLVVDEASMLDLALATRLFEAVPHSARIILLGDKHQLAAVEAGAVFSELCADPTLSADAIVRIGALAGIAPERIACAAPTMPTPLHDSVVWFTENFRFAGDSGIGRLAADINAGQAERTLAWLRSGAEPAVTWLDDAGYMLDVGSMRRIQDGYTRYLDTVRGDLGDRAAIFEGFGCFRVLCAERQGPRGVAAINDAVSRWFRQALDHPFDPGPRSQWYPGRPVMVLRNDYVLKLFNGDIGIVLPDEAGNLMVFFPDSDMGFRPVPPVRLPDHEPAFATTVHKAQGSEFDEVLLVLPAQASRVVTRELLYTAVTRSREKVTIVGGVAVLDKGILSPTQRHSGIISRLRETMSG